MARSDTTISAWLERGFTGSMLLLAFTAPLSIAATQIAWSLALLFWLLRLIYVRPTFAKDGITVAVMTFVGLSLISSIFSYEPEVSLRKMVGVSLVSIVFLAMSAINTEKLRRVAVGILLFSAVIASAYSVGKTAIGQNLKVVKLLAESPLRIAGVEANDTIQKVDGVSVSSPEELAKAISDNSSDAVVEITVYRYENIRKYDLPTGLL
ncbi:MAG: PDZ domain-containing protein, partial [Pyrinomonadaceae bacterium]